MADCKYGATNSEYWQRRFGLLLNYKYANWPNSMMNFRTGADTKIDTSFCSFESAEAYTVFYQCHSTEVDWKNIGFLFAVLAVI